MSSFHGLSQYSQVSLFPRRPKLPCTLTFDERLRCRVTRQALQHITPFSRPPKIILNKFRCCLFITSPSPRASPSPRVPESPSPRVPTSPSPHVPTSPSPQFPVPRPSPTSQSHVPSQSRLNMQALQAVPLAGSIWSVSPITLTKV